LLLLLSQLLAETHHNKAQRLLLQKLEQVAVLKVLLAAAKA